MGDLSEEEIWAWGGTDPELIIDRAISEIRRHRAMVARLEAWVAEMNGSAARMSAWEYAKGLRNRMKGDGNG